MGSRDLGLGNYMNIYTFNFTRHTHTCYTEHYSQNLKLVWRDDSGSARMNLLPSGETTTNPPLLWMILLHWFLLSHTPLPCPRSWKRSWRNAKWPITASRCASCWRRYRRTAATSQDGDRRLLSEWLMPLLWWVSVCVCERQTEGRGRLSCPDITGCVSRVLILPLPSICISWQFGSSVP